MNDFKVALPIIEPNEPPRVDVHDEWTQYPLWLSGKYGVDSIDGHQIGLSPALVRDLVAWGHAADVLVDPNDPGNSPLPPNHYEDGYELAKRVRAELSAEWIVTTTDPVTFKSIVVESDSGGRHAGS